MAVNMLSQLSIKEVKEIKAKYLYENYSVSMLCNIYDISKPLMNRILGMVKRKPVFPPSWIRDPE